MSSPATLPAPPRMSSPARLLGVFFSPGATFADIAREPHFILCLCVQFVVGILAPFYLLRRMTLPVVVQQIMASNPRTANLDPAQAQQTAQVVERITRWSFYSVPFIVLLSTVVLSLVFLFGMNFLLGQEAKFKGIFAVTAHALLPQTLLALVGMLALALKQDPTQLRFDNLVASNPGFFLDVTASPVARAFLTRLDLFVFWTMILLAIGFARLGRKLKTSTAFFMVFGLWLVWVLLLTAAAAL